MPPRKTSAGEVADEAVGLVHAAVRNFSVLGQLVVDLEDRRDAEQHEEAEVDQRVHDAGGRIAQQRLHVDAGAEVVQALLGVLRRSSVRLSGPPRSQFLTRWAKTKRAVDDEDRG